MYKLANGWTKETVMAQIKKYNNGTKATRESGSCTYLAKDGNRCAIGCFIPDGHKALLDDGSAYHIVDYPELAKLMPFDDRCILQVFQEIHDGGPKDGVYER